MNQKDQRIKKLYERGIRDKGEIARRIGYGGAMQDGVRRVSEAIERMGLESPNNKMMGQSPETKAL